MAIERLQHFLLLEETDDTPRGGKPEVHFVSGWEGWGGCAA